jgi:hypothetical protein
MFGCDVNILQNVTENLLRMSSWVQARLSPDGGTASKEIFAEFNNGAIWHENIYS